MSANGDSELYPHIQHREKTTHFIAMALLWTFVSSFAVLLGVALSFEFTNPFDADRRNGWFDLLKGTFVLTGTALTTLIGYYFGQREAKQAMQQAIKADTERKAATELAEEAVADQERASSAVESLKRELARTTESLATSDDPATFSSLQQRQRRMK